MCLSHIDVPLPHTLSKNQWRINNKNFLKYKQMKLVLTPYILNILIYNQNTVVYYVININGKYVVL